MILDSRVEQRREKCIFFSYLHFKFLLAKEDRGRYKDTVDISKPNIANILEGLLRCSLNFQVVYAEYGGVKRMQILRFGWRWGGAQILFFLIH